MKKKAEWGLMNVACLIFAVGIVFLAIKAGKEQYQPYVKAQEQKLADKMAEDEQLLNEYITKLENHFKDYQRVSAISELDMRKIRIMEAYLLEHGGNGGALQGRANDFMNVCKFSEINLDPFLMWSISMHETGFGHSDAINNLNNVGGIFKGGRLYKYQSLYRGIVDMMLEIKFNGYYDEVEGLFDGNTTQTTINQLGNIYCPVGASNDPTGLNKHWIPTISKHYNEMLEIYKSQI